MIVKLLSVLCRQCPSLTIDILDNTDVITILRDVLSGAPQPETKEELGQGSPSHLSRPQEQLSELLSLTAELLPPLPRNEIFAFQGLVTPNTPGAPTPAAASSSSSGSLKSVGRTSSRVRSGKKEKSPVTSPSEEKSRSAAASRGEESEDNSDPRIKFLAEHPQIMFKLSTILLPVVYHHLSLFLSVFNTDVVSLFFS